MKRKKTAKDSNEKGNDDKPAKKALHICKYCGRDISTAYRIKCAVCPGHSLCLPCFSVGASLFPHNNNHPYYIHGNLGFPLYDLAWTADEEMLLLEAIDMSGLGNWSAVAAHIGSKTAEECKAHYFEVYLWSPCFPLPYVKKEMEGLDPLTVMMHPEPKTEPKAQEVEVTKQEISQGALRPPGVSDAAHVDMGSPRAAQGTMNSLAKMQPPTTGAGPSSPLASKAAGQAKRVRVEKAPADAASPSQGAGQQLSTRGLPTARARPDQAAVLATPMPGAAHIPPDQAVTGVAGYDSTGYHGKRQEFDHEYDNEAELLISEICFLPTDTPAEVEDKLRLIEVYNQRLSERELRRDVVVKQGLFHQKKYQGVDKHKAINADKELINQLRVFAKYLTPQRHEALVDGFFLEEKLRNRLKELNEFRRNGVRNWDEVEVFENDQRKKSAEASKVTGDRTQRYIARTGTDDVSIMSQAAVVSLALADSGGKTRELSRLHPSASASHLHGATGGTTLGGGKAVNPNAAAHLAAWRARRGLALDITALPGSEHLTSKERSLCLNERLLPSQYLAYKASFLREAQRNGGVFPRQEARYMFRLRSSTTLKVFDLLVSCGWISTGTAPPGDAAATQQEGTGATKPELSISSPAQSNSKMS